MRIATIGDAMLSLALLSSGALSCGRSTGATTRDAGTGGMQLTGGTGERGIGGSNGDIGGTGATVPSSGGIAGMDAPIVFTGGSLSGTGGSPGGGGIGGAGTGGRIGGAGGGPGSIAGSAPASGGRISSTGGGGGTASGGRSSGDGGTGSGGSGLGGGAGSGVGHGGSGGAGMGGGSGDGGGGTSGGGTGGVAVSCSAPPVPAVAPVVVAATLSCGAAYIYSVRVAAGTGTDGYVAVDTSYDGTRPSFFFDIGASAATVEQILPDAMEIHMVSNAKGVLGVLGVVETSNNVGTALWLTRGLAAGTPAWVSNTITGILRESVLGHSIEAALGSDGVQYAAFRTSPDFDLALATRPSGGSGFSSATLGSGVTVGQNVLAVDASAAPHVMYWVDGQGLVDSQPGKALVTVLPSTSTTSPTSMQSVRPSGQGIAIAMSLADGVHIVRQRAGTGFDDIPIPATIPLSYTLPSGLIPCKSLGCPTVTQSGDFSRGQALAQASDGTLWLATVRDHVDRTAKYKNSTGPGDACQCWGSLGVGKFAPQDDHSSSTLVIQRIPSGATVPSSILWSLDLGLPPWTSYSVTNDTMSASFAGSLLFLAILTPNQLVQYLVLDTTNLK